MHAMLIAMMIRTTTPPTVPPTMAGTLLPTMAGTLTGYRQKELTESQSFHWTGLHYTHTTITHISLLPLPEGELGVGAAEE